MCLSIVKFNDSNSVAIPSFICGPQVSRVENSFFPICNLAGTFMEILFEVLQPLSFTSITVKLQSKHPGFKELQIYNRTFWESGKDHSISTRQS